MKYALIGCGRVAPNHIKAALENKLEIAAVCDIIPEHTESLLYRFDLQNDKTILRYTDYRKMIDENDIELAAIATDSGAHAEIALYCIDRGINIIIEKPVAMSIGDADEIIRRSEAKGVTVSACHQNRFNIAVQKTRRAIDEGRFGKISHGAVAVRWNRDRGYYNQAPWRGTWRDDGGTLMNQCIHGIDLLRWLMGGEIEEVYGVTARRLHGYIEAEDIGMAVVRFRGGAAATIEGTVNVYPADMEETIHIFGEKGTVKLGGLNANSIDVWRFADGEGEDNNGFFEAAGNVYGNGHTSIYADVADAVKNRRRPYVDAYAGRNALELVLAIYKSQKEGKPVRLPLDSFSSADMKGEFDA